ncbi:tobamovirus multiplication protein 2A [Pyrus x bretschneideri]|uniref:tobamovirus multiplication protein 2A n=1 Tax=Pyrus x bretschneideri TaxID=225117 RepID=UPI002030B935|nr:tobamovirus multiplication protein 2A [Pyrus x bretschneideri]XP_009371176.2 tobamovirus multiplication protein 2A [Pyrus x bretschneideri]XP_009371177.2 tobamovirus multiplication protein 2A [Pyrus x bretschneideri]
MACRGCLECLLKLLNFVLTLVGLAMVGYGIYLLVEYLRASDSTVMSSAVGDDHDLVQLSRPLLMTVSLSTSTLDNLPKAWFIYLFIGIGAIIFIISCFGCVGAMTRNGCCLSCYSVLVILLILVELGAAAFIFFDKSWEDEIPTDSSGDFEMIYAFLKAHWTIVRWVALGAVVFEALLFLLALVVRAANRPAEYDSDDELIAPRQQIRQPLIANRQAVPATGAPVAGALDQRPPNRNDAWSTRMREKYGLNTAEFTYNPSESQSQVSAQPQEERSRCIIM